MIASSTQIEIVKSTIRELVEMIDMKQWIHSLKSREEQINNESDIKKLKLLLDNNKKLLNSLELEAIGISESNLPKL